jgi:hypothetical protein
MWDWAFWFSNFSRTKFVIPGRAQRGEGDDKPKMQKTRGFRGGSGFQAHFENWSFGTPLP